MRVVSWNINSVRARVGRTCNFLRRASPDVLCLQETKCLPDQFIHEDIAGLDYHAEVFGQKSYNGVALVASERVTLTNVQHGFPGDPCPEQARVISATVSRDGHDDLWLCNLYVVNGKAPEHEAFQIKQEWLANVRGWLNDSFDPQDPLLLVGDWNITPAPEDTYDPIGTQGKIHCTEQERDWLANVCNFGLQDLHQKTGSPAFTWWDYRAGSFPRDRGLRIDLALGTPPVAARLAGVMVDREERRKSFNPDENPSDHAPLIVDLVD